MRIIILLLSAFLFIISFCHAQTNTFPSSGNVGIGTTSPASKFQISGASTYGAVLRLTNTGTGGADWSLISTTSGWDAGGQRLLFSYGSPSSVNAKVIFSNTGKVGIGTYDFSGNHKLYVAGSVLTKGITIDGGSDTRLLIKHPKEVTSNDGGLVLTDGTNTLMFDGNEIQSVTNLYINNDNASDLLINKGGGNVGIGTISPQSKLAVNGTITAQKIKVMQTGWADYVFDSAFVLPALSTLEKAIGQYGHLPGFPSAETIAKEGLDLSAMQQKQMAQIETLLLYLLQQQKQLKQQQAQIAALQQQIVTLTEQIKKKQ